MIVPTCLLLCGTAFAQLGPADIAAMREEGQAKGWTFTVGENAATKLPLEQLTGYDIADVDAFLKQAPPAKPVKGSKALPARWDWREQTSGGLPPVRDQGSCGSCWAFSTVGALECAVKIKDRINVNLSEQWLVSCATGLLWHGCDWGTTAHDWHKGVKTDSCGGSGAVLESNYPYTASAGACACPVSHHYTIRDWHYVNSNPLSVPPIEDLKQAIYQFGPITGSLDAGGSFSAYTSGVYNDNTSSSDLFPNHSIVMVGWDDTLGTGGAFIIRNSWGTSWGMGGYGYIAYGISRIGYGADYIEYGAPGDDLSVDPPGGWSSGGPEGGPFTPDAMVYTLENTGTASLNWNATAPAWIALEPSSGALAAGAAVTVTATVTGVSLTPGRYTGDITFTNQSSGAAQTRAVTLNIGYSAPILFSLDEDPGWAGTGQWAFGVPSGQDGDPFSGYTGANVYGYNLDGAYADDMGEEYLVAGPVDFRGVVDAELRFMRWLGVELDEYDHAKVQVSNDGTTWVPVWENPGATLEDEQWIACVYDISGVADGQPAVYVRWVMGPTDGSVSFAGWNIDDVDFRGTVIAEGEGTVEGVTEGEGTPEGEGVLEGEGMPEGEGSTEGIAEGEGSAEGEGQIEGEPVTVDFCAAMDRVVAAAGSPTLAPLIDMLGSQADLIDALVCATADLNGPLTIEGETITPSGNGLLDGAYELGVVAELLNHPVNYAGLGSGTVPPQVQPGVDPADVAAAFAANHAALYDPLAPMIPLLPNLVEYYLGITLTPAQRDEILALFPDLVMVLAGYATLGDDDSIALVLSVTQPLAEVISTLPQTPDAFQRLSGILGYNGDADGDGFCNAQEYAWIHGAGTPGAYVFAALSPTLVPPGEPGCLRIPEGEGGLEGSVEGLPEGSPEGQPEGTADGEGVSEGQLEGSLEGQPEGEGAPLEGEGTVEGQTEGIAEGEGLAEGQPEGDTEGEGSVEGQPEGVIEGTSEGVVEGAPEGTFDGEVPEGEGTAEGNPEAEILEGAAEGEPATLIHSGDPNGDRVIQLTELLRVIQFFNMRGFACAAVPESTEDGYLPGPGVLHDCAPHSSDYAPQNWEINLTELLRLIQFFNMGGYHSSEGTEDGFAPGLPG
jgi:hypothetical protein